jgi:hypothetical protein
VLGACDSSTSPDASTPPDEAAQEPAEAGEPADGASSEDDEDAAPPPDAGPVDAGPIEPACEVTLPTSCPTPPVYYEDIAPIIMNRCLSCHDGKGEQWALTSYSHVTAWHNEIGGAMATCSMPPSDAGIDMPAAEREQILTWLVCKMPMRGDAGTGFH